LFGEISQEEMHLNDIGKIIREEWLKTQKMRPGIKIDEFVVMPNHLHGIIMVNDGRGTLQRAPTKEQFGKPTSNSIPTIVRLFKSVTTKRINEFRMKPGSPVWQRNYYDHVIRDDNDFTRIREYIVENPLKWSLDENNPDRPTVKKKDPIAQTHVRAESKET
jgi:REP element-mobilizing transposase RayT